MCVPTCKCNSGYIPSMGQDDSPYPRGTCSACVPKCKCNSGYIPSIGQHGSPYPYGKCSACASNR